MSINPCDYLTIRKKYQVEYKGIRVSGMMDFGTGGKKGLSYPLQPYMGLNSKEEAEAYMARLKEYFLDLMASNKVKKPDETKKKIGKVKIQNKSSYKYWKK